MRRAEGSIPSVLNLFGVGEACSIVLRFFLDRDFTLGPDAGLFRMSDQSLVQLRRKQVPFFQFIALKVR
jgi:hypothetical protein